MSGQKLNWLGLDDLPDDNRHVNVEQIQEREMERLIGWELNLWLMWRGVGAIKGGLLDALNDSSPGGLGAPRWPTPTD